MSDYRKEKVLRIPIEKCGINKHMARALEGNHPDLFNMCADRYFQIAPTEGDFIDYVLKSEIDDGYGEYGKVRELTFNEKVKYLPVFQQIIPNVNMNDVRLVEYCWYDCSEAPDYYDEADDPFYSEV